MQIHYQDIQPDKTYIVRTTCKDCKRILTETKKYTGRELQIVFNQIASGSFLVDNCPNGCWTDHSCLNLNTNLEIHEVDSAYINEFDPPDYVEEMY